MLFLILAVLLVLLLVGAPTVRGAPNGSLNWFWLLVVLLLVIALVN